MTDGVKKTVSVLGKNVDIIFPNQETINTMKGTHFDMVELGDGLVLNIRVTETRDDRGRKHFTVQTAVFVNRHHDVSNHTTFPVTPDKVLETLSREIDLTFENLASNIEAIYSLSKRDVKKFGELAARFDSTKAKTAEPA